MKTLAELKLLPEKDLVDSRRTLEYLEEYFAEFEEPLEIRFVVTAEDVEDFRAGKRPDIKRWVVREREETE